MHNTEGVKPYYWKKWLKVDNLALNATAEILRTPLLELCLQAKLLACNDTSIRYVLNKPENPFQNYELAKKY